MPAMLRNLPNAIKTRNARVEQSIDAGKVNGTRCFQSKTGLRVILLYGCNESILLPRPLANHILSRAQSVREENIRLEQCATVTRVDVNLRTTT